MIYKRCNHEVSVRITFDAGSEKSVYDLCNYCKEFPIFKKSVISQEPITQNTPQLEILN